MPASARCLRARERRGRHDGGKRGLSRKAESWIRTGAKGTMAFRGQKVHIFRLSSSTPAGARARIERERERERLARTLAPCTCASACPSIARHRAPHPPRRTHSDAMRGTRGCGGWRRGTRTMDAASGERAGRERGRESARERAARARMEDGRGRTFNKGECGRGLTLTADFTAKTRERWRSLASRSVEDSRRGRRRRCCAARCVALLRSRGRV